MKLIFCDTIELFKARWTLWWKFFLITILLNLTSTFRDLFELNFDSWISIVVEVVSMLFYIWVDAGLMSAIYLEITEKKSLRLFESLKWSLSRVPSYLFYLIIYSLLGFSGLFLFIIPGILVVIYLGFVVYAAVLKEDVSPLSFSINLVKGHFWQMSLVMFLSLVIYLPGLGVEVITAKGVEMAVLELFIITLYSGLNILRNIFMIHFFIKLSKSDEAGEIKLALS